MSRTRRLAPYLMSLALLGPAAVPAVAAAARTSPDQASEFVQDLGSQAVTLLASYDVTKPGGRQAEFRALVLRGFDLDSIGRFALGGTWRSATPAQQQEYQRLFATWTVNSYAHRLSVTKGAAFTVIDTQPTTGTDVLVRTQIDQPDGVSLQLALRVRGANGQMKIVDMLVNGISMDVTQRDEFAAVIQHQGIEGLLGILRSRISNIEAEASRE